MKKFLSLLLVLVTCLSLFACGKVENEDETKKNNKKDDEKAEYEDQHGDLAKEAEEKLPQYILEAIRAYYGVDFGGEITDKMVASVETLTIDIPAVTVDPNMVHIDAAVNGSSFSGLAIRPAGRVLKERMESIYKLADEFGEKIATDPEPYKEYAKYSNSVEDWYEKNLQQLKNFAALKDINADGLSEIYKNAILEAYPDITETGPFYALETLMTNAEFVRLFVFCDVFAGFENIVPMGELDLSCLEALPNLKSVTCDERFNVKNCPVKLETLEAPVLEGHYKCGDDLTWTFDGETLTIKGEGDMWDFTDTGTPWWGDITSVVIDDGITSIGADAFNGFDIEKITIHDSVTKIGANAFANCKSLTEIDLPDSLSYIGDAAFRSCSALTTLTLPNSVSEIGESAFSFCENIKTITLSSSLEAIPHVAFAHCSSIKLIIIPASVTSISNDSFIGCDNLLLVTYLGTKAQWGNLFEDGFDRSANRYGVKCSDGLF
ncbi:MAG: leucine-rich repeat domain-containing protein [Clostridia bacterium]|nr:leucine-rich repeat domain-containing protein [Clostridia bacterium]